MKPSIVLSLKREAIREITSRYRAANPRVFGSVVHGDDHEGSDLDLLVDAMPCHARSDAARPWRLARRAGRAAWGSC